MDEIMRMFEEANRDFFNKHVEHGKFQSQVRLDAVEHLKRCNVACAELMKFNTMWTVQHRVEMDARFKKIRELVEKSDHLFPKTVEGKISNMVIAALTARPIISKTQIIFDPKVDAQQALRGRGCVTIGNFGWGIRENVASRKLFSASDVRYIYANRDAILKNLRALKLDTEANVFEGVMGALPNISMLARDPNSGDRLIALAPPSPPNLIEIADRGYVGNVVRVEFRPYQQPIYLIYRTQIGGDVSSSRLIAAPGTAYTFFAILKIWDYLPGYIAQVQQALDAISTEDGPDALVDIVERKLGRFLLLRST